MKYQARRERFRALISGSECVRPAPVNDPISARVAESLGFEMAIMTGSAASLAVLAAPDLVLLTMTELAEQSRRICRAAEIPVLVDADHGFGNALNVTRTVEELEAAGVAALTIEDTLLPQAFDAREAELTSLEEGLGKMRAAVAARSDPALVIAARTSVAGLADKAEAVRRTVAYAQSGVDALFLSMVKSRDMLDAIADAVKIPIFLGAAQSALHDTGYLTSRGVRIWLFGHQPMVASIEAIHASMAKLRESSDSYAMSPIAVNEAIGGLLRQERYAELAGEFMRRPAAG